MKFRDAPHPGTIQADPARPHILYLAPDLDDTAVWRRVRMLEIGGANVTVAGFSRGATPHPASAIVLGRTQDGRMVQRLGAVARAAFGLRRRLAAVPRPDAVVARNLEMLALAAGSGLRWPDVTGRRAAAPPRLVYEVLDIHRMMVGDSVRARSLRAVERRLAARAGLLLTSSPGFVRHYFVPHGIGADRVRLVENKPLATEGSIPTPAPLPVSGPLAIGWFGILRCQWSLRTLDALTRGAHGRYRVDLRGRPALDAIPDFHAVVAANPDLRFEGAYRPEDLPRHYGEVALTWMVDRFDAGGNSDWLLPNRLYEGGAQGRIPVALDGTEVAAELRRRGLGLILPRPDIAAVESLLGQLVQADLDRLGTAVRACPTSSWTTSAEECADLLRDMLGSGGTQARARLGGHATRPDAPMVMP